MPVVSTTRHQVAMATVAGVTGTLTPSRKTLATQEAIKGVPAFARPASRGAIQASEAKVSAAPA